MCVNMLSISTPPQNKVTNSDEYVEGDIRVTRLTKKETKG